MFDFRKSNVENTVIQGVDDQESNLWYTNFKIHTIFVIQGVNI